MTRCSDVHAFVAYYTLKKPLKEADDWRNSSSYNWCLFLLIVATIISGGHRHCSAQSIELIMAGYRSRKTCNRAKNPGRLKSTWVQDLNYFYSTHSREVLILSTFTVSHAVPCISRYLNVALGSLLQHSL